MYSAAIHKDRENCRRAREGVERETERSIKRLEADGNDGK